MRLRSVFILLGEFVISSVLSCHSKNLKQQTNQCYSSVLLGKTKDSIPLRSEGGPTQKNEEKRREASILLGFLLFHICLLPPDLALCKLGQPGVLFVLPEVLILVFRTFFCSIFMGFSLLCLLATTILDSFFLLYLPNRMKTDLFQSCDQC